MIAGSRSNKSRQDRKRAKREAKREPHGDKYADQRMAAKLVQLAEHFNGEEAHHG